MNLPDGTGPVAPPGDPALARRCRNCGAEVPERYCSRCGQDESRRLASVRRMLADFADDQLSLNAALPRTAWALMARPGHLTREYLAGRVERYIRPVRILLVSLLLAFLAFALTVGSGGLAGMVISDRGDAVVTLPEIDEAGVPRWQNFGFEHDPESTPRLLRPIAQRLEHQSERLNSVPPRESVRLLFAAAISASGRIALLIVPLFALLLKLLHLFQRRLYAEHFVFSLHFHAAMACALTLTIVTLAITRHPLALAPLPLYGSVYALVAMRVAFPQPWWLATLKTLALGILYSVLLTLALTASFTVGLFLA